MIAERARRLVRRILERLLDRFREGAEPPARLSEATGEHVAIWAAEHPRASRREWAQFAADLAAFSYREGYARGVEYVERDPAFFDDLDPDAVADVHDPGWRELSPPFEVSDPAAIVVEDEELEDLSPALEALEDGPHAHDADLVSRAIWGP